MLIFTASNLPDYQSEIGRFMNHKKRNHFGMHYKFSARCLVSTMALLLSVNVSASNLYIALDNYEYNFSLGDFALDLSPMGAAIGGSLDLREDLLFQYEVGKWSDDGGVAGSSSAVTDFESTLINVGMQKRFDDWNLTVSYTDIEDDALIAHGRELEFSSAGKVDLQSLKVTMGREEQVGLWARYYSAGLQRDDAKSVVYFDQTKQMVLQQSNALHAMLKLGGDYYWAGDRQNGLLLGGALSWFHQISSDDSVSEFTISEVGTLSPIPLSQGSANGPGNVGGNGTGGANINRTFGDSFGLLALYATYQFNESWSLDWSTSLGFAGDINANAHALTLSFAF